MRRRRRPDKEIHFSFDSFLDVVANVVGIIIKLILVAWVGARTYTGFEIPESFAPNTQTVTENKLIDKVIKEPLGGAHRNMEEAFENVKKEIVKQLTSLKKEKKDKLIQKRIEKFAQMGVYTEK